MRFVAPNGSYWTVHEIAERRNDADGHALIFVSDEGFRRVRDYPEDWRTLEPETLWALSWKR